ncbi:MAG: Coenzyme F420 hydrogenase/dehydrogenase, beta subunit C-terminal domain [Candidatus Methanomethylophilaceae archaeon]|nr:Coenzyme F420 hydrogenase/dehydrogenase, beta subunit C-terminal domain [Candidatus Methanomethylophilaceae archaeon]
MSDVVTDLRSRGKDCCGCAACVSVCPKGAVSMVLDDEGICRSSVDILACVDCGLCSKVCPILNLDRSNDSKPSFYAYRAEESEVLRSSSGGAFFPMAQRMISRGGYVCGVVFDSDLNAVFRMTQDIAVVRDMQKSKYVFSEMGSIYGEIEEALKSGKEVLFVGCPCQVAAVKNRIKDKEKLYTADLLCAGLPAKGIYRKYLEEISEGKKIKNLIFRDSELPYGTLVIEYEDGTRKTNFRDLYFAGFLKHMFKSRSCSECEFASIPRQGDVTIGDLWNYDKIIYDLDAKTGISCVVVNSEKGREMFGVLSENATFLREIPMSFAMRFNRFNVKRPAGPASERFHYLLDRGYSVRKALDYSINSKYDVAITGFWRAPNYGGDLTYYALYNVVKDMGLEPIFVEACNPKAPPGSPPSPVHMDTKYPAFSIAPWYASKEKQAEINLRVKNVMVGSDQVWNPKLLSPGGLNAYSLDFVSAWRNSVAYASSFGATSYEADTPQKKEHIDLLKRIKHVSVREKSGVDICAKFGIDAKLVLDPVMLCDMKHYEELIDSADMEFPKRYMLAFIRHINVHMDPVLMSSALGVTSLNVGGPELDYSKPVSYPMINVHSVENWLKSISRAEFILTDSFHATVLAILFRKQFISVYGRMDEASGNGRMSTLLNSLGLSGRLFRTTEEAVQAGAHKREIDYDAVYGKLDALRAECMAWLESAIER